MLLDALNNGATKEELSRAFKVEVGLIDDIGPPSLSEIVGISDDHNTAIKEAGASLMKRFPAFANIANEPGFSEQCKITHQRVDQLFERLDQIQDVQGSYRLPLANSYLSKTSDKEGGGCNACGGGEGACGRMVRTYACWGVSALGGWPGIALGLWLCTCQFCPADLPGWACGGPR